MMILFIFYLTQSNEHHCEFLGLYLAFPEVPVVEVIAEIPIPNHKEQRLR